MHRLIMFLSAAVLVFFSAMMVRAADTLDKGPTGEEPGKRRRLSTEEGDVKAKEPRKTNGTPSRAEIERRREQMKSMTPEERAAKRKEIKQRLEKRIAELQAKKANDSITPQESRELERREQILKRFEADGNTGPRPKAVLTNAPAQK